MRELRSDEQRPPADIVRADRQARVRVREVFADVYTRGRPIAGCRKTITLGDTAFFNALLGQTVTEKLTLSPAFPEVFESAKGYDPVSYNRQTLPRAVIL